MKVTMLLNEMNASAPIEHLWENINCFVVFISLFCEQPVYMSHGLSMVPDVDKDKNS